MPSLITVKGSYYAQFYDSSRSPKQKQIPLRTKDKKAAERAYVLLQREIALGKDPWAPKNIEPTDDTPLPTLSEGIESFFENRVHLRASTLKTYRHIFDIFLRTVRGDMLIQNINKVTIRKWISSLDVKNSTKANYIRHVKALFGHFG